MLLLLQAVVVVVVVVGLVVVVVIGATYALTAAYRGGGGRILTTITTSTIIKQTVDGIYDHLKAEEPFDEDDTRMGALLLQTKVGGDSRGDDVDDGGGVGGCP